jgi:uncharacterized protein
MQVTVTGATGLIGRQIVAALLARGDDVTVLTREPARAWSVLGSAVDALAWDPLADSAPVAGCSGAGAVIHLAGESVAQRWSPAAKRAILDSRVAGTRNLVAGLRQAGDAAAPVLVSASAVGYYGPRGDEEVDESAPPGTDFLAQVCVAWEQEVAAAQQLGLRVATVRTGIVLDRDGGALKRMLLPFRLGVGGPVAGGRQYMPWITVSDLVALYLAAVDGEDYAGALNAAAPDPVTNRDFSRALGRALHRPAIAPIPAITMKLLYGEMAQLVTTGQRAIPTRTQQAGFRFAHPDLDAALAEILNSPT